MQQRSKAKDVFPGQWESSLSGHQDVSETASHAAKRELWEEVGIKTKRLSRLGTYPLVSGPERLRVTLYVLKGYDGRLRLDKKEVASARFITIDELRREMKRKKFTPSTKKAVRLAGLR